MESKIKYNLAGVIISTKKTKLFPFNFMKIQKKIRPLKQTQVDKNPLLFQTYTVNNYMQVTGIATGENFAFFIYRHFFEIL